MKKKILRLFSVVLMLCLMVTSIPNMSMTVHADNASNIPETDEDVYVLNYAGNNFSTVYGNYAFDKAYMYPSPHINYLIVDEDGDGVNESHWNYTGHKVMNMINTTLLKEGGEGAYASVPTYCLDAIYGEGYTYKFRRVNLEDADYFADENAAGRLRAILSRVFPFKTNMKKLASASNAWLASASDAYADLDPIESLTETECITATQTAIWVLTNGVEPYKYYLKTVPTRFSKSICLYPEYLNQEKSAYTATNIETLTEYLLSLEPERAKETIISESSVKGDLNVEKEADGTYTIQVIATVDADVKGDTKLEVLTQAELIKSGTKKSSSETVKNGKHEYELNITGLHKEDVVSFSVELVVQGDQQASGIFLYEPWEGRESHQTMAGYSDWTLPVRVRKEFVVSNNEKINISGQKVWEDNNDSAQKRPENITVKLMNGESEVRAISVSGNGNVWEYEFTDLPMYDSNNEEIDYTIEEIVVDGYTTKIEGFDITNTLDKVEETTPTETSPSETTPAETTPAETTPAETTSGGGGGNDDDEPRTTAPTTTAAETTAPETTAPAATVPETVAPETVVYRGVEIPKEILDQYPGKTLDELYDMGVLGEYFEKVPTGLLPATSDATIIWTALAALSGIGLAGTTVIRRKREDDEE